MNGEVDNIDLVAFRRLLYKSMTSDFSKNGTIDLQDYAILSQNWQKNNPAIDIAPIFKPDGVVDIRELIVFAEHWLSD